MGMINTLKKEFADLEYVAAKTPGQLVSNSKVIIAATTSKTPLFESSPDNILGKTFISIGSFRPDMQEFPHIVIESADDIFVDTMFAAKESGDIANPLKDNVIQKGEIKEFAGLLGKNEIFENRTIFFKSAKMNISSNLNTAYSSALGGIQQGQAGIVKNASDIASIAKPDSNVNLTESLVDLKVNQQAVEVNSKVLASVDDTVGTLLDILA
jgi:hypothetical protein